MSFVFNPVTGLMDTAVYPSSPVSETAARQQFMDLFNQIKDYLNTGVTPKTTANLTYFVATTGSDSNDGLTSGTAFLTIAKAISMIPQIVNHTVIINVAAGTYPEAVLMFGFSGKGTITINGDTAVSTSYTVQRFSIQNNSIPITVRGFNANSTSVANFIGAYNSYLIYNFCNSTQSAAVNGFDLGLGGFYAISNCTVSNKAMGITASNCSVYSDNNSGSLNTVGLRATIVATIGKNGTQPSGTTAETQITGGVIR